MREILFLLLVLTVGGWWVRRQDRQSDGVRQQPQRKALPPSEKMVRCAECGTYIPLSDALHDGDVHFCSATHRQAFMVRQR